MGKLEPKIVILILAGGQGSRMGTIKQLLPWKDSTLLENVIKHAKSSKAHEIIVVLGAHASEIRSKISDFDIQFIENKKWESGLGTSISCGVTHILNESIDATGVMVLLADQPLIDTQYINKMMDTFIRVPNKMVTTNYGTREGVPAIFGQQFFKELQTLNQDFGAKDLINKNKDSSFSLNPEGKELDVDTIEDYNTLINQQFE